MNKVKIHRLNPLGNQTTMKTETELNEEILKVTMEILKKHPELSKQLAEMPVTIPDQSSPEVTNKLLGDYLHSLNTILSTYTENQKTINTGEINPEIKTNTL